MSALKYYVLKPPLVPTGPCGQRNRLGIRRHILDLYSFKSEFLQ